MVPPAGVVAYKWFTGDYSDEKENEATTKDSKQGASNDPTTTLPAGFRPIRGIDNSGQIVVESASGKPDSVITMEPIVRKRFGRGENQDQQ